MVLATLSNVILSMLTKMEIIKHASVITVRSAAESFTIWQLYGLTDFHTDSVAQAQSTIVRYELPGL